MLRKHRAMLKQEEGFTLMELMIVVVIIGILAGIAIPIYNGVQDKAKIAVGEANAQMLNRSIKQMMQLDKALDIGTFAGNTKFDGNNSDHHDKLMEFVGFKGNQKELQYVKWNPISDELGDFSDGAYTHTIEASELQDSGLKDPPNHS